MIAAGGDNDVEMDGGPVKDGDMDSRDQPALPPEKANLCQYSGLTRSDPFTPAWRLPEADRKRLGEAAGNQMVGKWEKS